MVEIPLMLRNPEFRFILLGSSGRWAKCPIERGWSTTKNYSWDDLRIKNHTGNIGVMGGYGNLLIIDFDDIIFQTELTKILPETFTVKTGGKGLNHMYYLVDKPFKKFNIALRYETEDGEKEVDVKLDLQCIGGQVVCPNSIHPNGKFYKVINDVPIAKLGTSVLLSFFEKQQFENQQEYKRPATSNCVSRDQQVEEIKKNVLISDVLKNSGISVTTNPCKCPCHSSSGNRCFSFDDDNSVFNCYHCGIKGDIFDLYKEINNCDFLEAFKQLKRMI